LEFLEEQYLYRYSFLPGLRVCRVLFLPYYRIRYSIPAATHVPMYEFHIPALVIDPLTVI
jgi:hypothetical protein